MWLVKYLVSKQIDLGFSELRLDHCASHWPMPFSQEAQFGLGWTRSSVENHSFDLSKTSIHRSSQIPIYFQWTRCPMIRHDWEDKVNGIYARITHREHGLPSVFFFKKILLFVSPSCIVCGGQNTVTAWKTSLYAKNNTHWLQDFTVNRMGWSVQFLFSPLTVLCHTLVAEGLIH